MMRVLVAAASAALLVTGCNRDASEVDVVNDTNASTDSLTLDQNASLGAAPGTDMATSVETEDMVTNDLTANDLDTNSTNGL